MPLFNFYFIFNTSAPLLSKNKDMFYILWKSRISMKLVNFFANFVYKIISVKSSFSIKKWRLEGFSCKVTTWKLSDDVIWYIRRESCHFVHHTRAYVCCVLFKIICKYASYMYVRVGVECTLKLFGNLARPRIGLQKLQKVLV